MRRILISAMVAMTVCLGVIGCNYNVQKSPPLNSDFDAKSVRVDFAVVFSTVLEKRCLECHSNARGNKGKVNLETYKSVIQNLSDIRNDVADGSMPKNRPALTPHEKNLVLAWIARGAPEFDRGENSPITTPTPAPAEPPVDVSKLDFKTVFKSVIEPACLKCHSAPENEGKVNLETYKEVFKHRVEIERDVKDGSMPKKKALSAIQKEVILRWLAAGAHEEGVTTHPLPPPVKEADPTDPSDPQYPKRSVAELEQLKRGQYIYRAGLCANCHTPDPARPQAGGLAIRSPFGTFYTPNISRDRRTGIGGWSEADFKRALREGLSPKWRYYYPSFPYQNYSKLSDRDIRDLWSYVMALPAVLQRNQPHRLAFPYNERAFVAIWQGLNFPIRFGFTADNFRTARGPLTNIRERSTAWNRGAYLVEGAFHCTQCHTPRGNLGSLKLDEWMAGSALSGEKKSATNITPDRATGLGDWSETDWVKFLQTAARPDDVNVGGEMRKIVLRGTAYLTLDDQKAVATYLRSLLPVRSYEFRHPVRKNEE